MPSRPPRTATTGRRTSQRLARIVGSAIVTLLLAVAAALWLMAGAISNLD